VQYDAPYCFCNGGFVSSPSPPHQLAGRLPFLGKSQRLLLGQTYITPGAQALLLRARLPAMALLALHAQGEWGALDETDRVANERALFDGSRVVSRYEVLYREAVLIVTDASDSNGERTATTLLLPSEY